MSLNLNEIEKLVPTFYHGDMDEDHWDHYQAISFSKADIFIANRYKNVKYIVLIFTYISPTFLLQLQLALFVLRDKLATLL